MVKDERRTVNHPKEESDRPEDVGRIAGLDDGKATSQACLEAESEGGEEGVEVLEDEGDPRPAGGIGSVLVKLHAGEPGVGGVAGSLWAHDGDLEPGVNERPALEPDAAVERDGQVLHNDEDPCPLAWPSRGRRVALESLHPRALGARLSSCDPAPSPRKSFVTIKCLEFGSQSTVEIDDPGRRECRAVPRRSPESKRKRARRRRR